MSYPDVEFAAAEPASVLNRDGSSAALGHVAQPVSEDGPDGVAESFETPISSSESLPANVSPNPLEIEFDGTLRVNGYVAGIIRSSEGYLIVEAAGTVDADIFVPVVTIHGCVRGDIRAQRVELSGSARVIGDIATVKLSIEPGATFEGRCTFSQSA